MAQTTIASPQAFSPAYNQLKFIIDSTNKNLTGFRYIFDVYLAGTITKIGQYKVMPRINDGYGEEDLSKLLQSQVTWTLSTTATATTNALGSYYDYDVKVGEEYVYELPYTSSLSNNSGNVQINATNTFAIGDQVVIIQDDGGVANPQLDGLHTVTSASGSAFTVNSLWADVTNITINGTVKYADNRKVITRNITTFSNYRVFNGAVRHMDWMLYNQTDYVLDGITKEFVTNQPQSFHATIGQDIWFNARTRSGSTFVFQNDAGDTFTKSISALGTFTQTGVGPNNTGTLTATVGTLPLIKPNTKYYDVYYNSSLTVGPQDSQKYRIYIDDRKLIEEYHLLFLDRMGSWSSFAFQLKAYEKGDIQREMYNKNVDGYVRAGSWTYGVEEFGFHYFNTNVIKSMDLNSNWMDEGMAQYYEELMTSPMTYLKITKYMSDETGTIFGIEEEECSSRIPESTTYVPVMVTNNAYEVYKQRNKNLIRQSVSVRFSNQDNING
jgi:hypothetical protein